MCGRYVLKSAPRHIREAFGIPDAWNETIREDNWWTPRFNLAPGQDAPIVRMRDGQRHLDLLRWGLIPSWARDPSIASRLINARSETAPEKPAFRAAFKLRRCIVPADGFYEWQLQVAGKQPFYIHRADGRLLAMAGLWEHWMPPGAPEPLQTFTILTTAANAWMQPLHERMPVILKEPDVARWLDPASKPADLQSLLASVAEEHLAAYAVTKAVGNVRNDRPANLEPVSEPSR